jgi:hypothetical protein
MFTICSESDSIMFVSVSFLTTDVEGEVTTGSLQYRAWIVDDFCPFVSIGVEGVGTGQLLSPPQRRDWNRLT